MMTYDTIKLQDALDTLDKIGSLDTPEDRKYAREMFLSIPSALPEHLTDEDLETIRIHLHAFMEGLCNQHRWKEAEEYERIIVRLKYLAMSQTGQWIFEDDAISRQAAIDALEQQAREMSRWSERYAEQAKGVLTAKNVIEDLPSAQPERTKRIIGKSRDGMTMWYQCELCNEPVDEKDLFCSGCGRKFEDG